MTAKFWLRSLSFLVVLVSAGAFAVMRFHDPSLTETELLQLGWPFTLTALIGAVVWGMSDGLD